MGPNSCDNRLRTKGNVCGGGKELGCNVEKACGDILPSVNMGAEADDVKVVANFNTGTWKENSTHELTRRMRIVINKMRNFDTANRPVPDQIG